MDARLGRLLNGPGQQAGAEMRVHGVARRVMLVVVGLGCGFSPLFSGYFDISVWGVIAIGVIVLAIGLLVARPAIPTGAAGVALLGILAYAAWCLLSMQWAESADRALTEGDRWILAGVFLLVLILLIADRRDGEIFVSCTVVAVLGVAVYDLTTMFVGDGSELFGGSRLLEPLGYVNGLGGYFLLGFWPLVALAERVRAAALSGAAAGGATLLGALVLLTNSRGTAFAFGVSALILLVLLPGRLRRVWLLLAVLAGLAIAWVPLTDITQPLQPGQFSPDEETIERGATWALLVSVGVAAAWGLGTWAVEALRHRSPALDIHLPRVSAAVLGAVAVVLIASSVIAVGNPFRTAGDEYEAFTELQPIETTARSTSTRFTSGGGNRYDYWRIAWQQFTDDPMRGVGAGNFDRTYFLERRTDEDIRQAHSIELQTLGDTGIIGALALGTFLIAVFVGLWRRAQAARDRGAETGLIVAAGGMFIVWIAQTSVDWLHLIPGLTGIALGGAAVLLGKPEVDVGEGSGLRPVRSFAVLPALGLAIVAIVFIGRPTLAEHLRADAQDELRVDPRAALRSATDSLSLNPDSLQGYYLKSAALARLGAYMPAQQALSEAIHREPHNFVSWALLGDLTTRRGELSDALRSYRRASRLNPRDRELRLLGSRRDLVERIHRDPSQANSLVESLLVE